MPRINPVNPDQAEGKAKDLLNAVQKAMGATPNIFKAFANSPASLEGYLNLSGALKKGILGAQLGEKIALTTAGANGCTYCASAHSFIGDKLGIEAEEIKANLVGQSSDVKAQAALTFARKLIELRGKVSATDVETVRNAGFSNEAIVEILTHVALNTLTNYFNEAFKTDVDFPEVSLSDIKKVA